jgi:hypothetical protein
MKSKKTPPKAVGSKRFERVIKNMQKTGFRVRPASYTVLT